MTANELRSFGQYNEVVFESQQCAHASFQDCEFETCQFRDCDFSEATFVNCRFIDCDFYDCNCNVAKFQRSRMRQSQFYGCKLTGVNWTILDWSGYALEPPFSFVQCELSFSVFPGLVLPQLLLHECVAHEVDFSHCDLTGADFHQTDLTGAYFHRTKLDQCNFEQAYNFSIDPTHNSLVAARFSTPEVLSLLTGFKIKIDSE